MVQLFTVLLLAQLDEGSPTSAPLPAAASHSGPILQHHVDTMFHHFSAAPCPVAASQRNWRGWRVAAEDRVHSASANSLPTAQGLAQPRRTLVCPLDILPSDAYGY